MIISSSVDVFFACVVEVLCLMCLRRTIGQIERKHKKTTQVWTQILIRCQNLTQPNLAFPNPLWQEPTSQLWFGFCENGHEFELSSVLIVLKLVYVGRF